MINDLNYEGIKFPVSRKDYCRIERQSNICINICKMCNICKMD